MSEEQKRAYDELRGAGVLFDADTDDPKGIGRTINLSDTFGWAEAYGEEIEPDEVLEVLRLYHSYGWCGIVYWSSRKGSRRSEFHDINRFIDFVANEERIRVEFPNSSKRAYHKATYTLSAQPQEPDRG